VSQPLVFSAPLFITSGSGFAVVLSTPGSCSLSGGNILNAYPLGAAFVKTVGAWSPMSGISDYAIDTLADLPDNQFISIYRGAPQITEGANHRAIVTGDHVVAAVYDAGVDTYATDQNLGANRNHGTATKLNNGKILLTGGANGSTVTNSAQLYDPSTGIYTSAGNMNYARQYHTATLLADGRVFIAGGYTDAVTYVPQTEIFTPGANTFSYVGDLLTVRVNHQATLLPSGKVLITGGGSNGSQSPTYYDGEVFTPPITTGFGSFAAVPDTLANPRMFHRDVALSDGRVLITGGQISPYPNTSSVLEIYDETCNCFTAVGTSIPRTQHTATVLATGKVLLAGGSARADGLGPMTSLEVIDPSNSFSSTHVGELAIARYAHAAMRLCPDGSCNYSGKVIFAGGAAHGTDAQSIEIFDPAGIPPAGTINQAYAMQVPGTGTFTVVSGMMPAGLSLASGTGQITGTALDAGQFTVTIRVTSASGAISFKTVTFNIAAGFIGNGSMSVARWGHVAEQLNNGLVLLAGGSNPSTSAELYSPATGSGVGTGSLSIGRCNNECSSIKLADGNVLAAGGTVGSSTLDTAEVYDAGTSTWSATTGNMTSPRQGAIPIRLSSNKILIVGGLNWTTYLSTADLYDPLTKFFSSTGSMSIERYRPTAVRLADGRVLVAGGSNSGGQMATAEIYDDQAGTFAPTGSMTEAKQQGPGILLPDGRVLIAGGWRGTSLQTAEVFNPVSGTFTAVGNMTVARSHHSAVLLNNGRVLVFGGYDAGGALLSSAEIFDPSTNTFTAATGLTSTRANASVVLLADGRVLITGGQGVYGGGAISSVEIYDPGQ
jgi:hypothetical protein